MNDPFTNAPVDDSLLKEVIRRQKTWQVFWSIGFSANLMVGVFGVVSSSISAISHEPFSRYAAAISAVCFAIIGFARPDQFYYKYILPWRILDRAIFRYRFQNGKRDELIDALAEAEMTLTAIEQQKELHDAKDRNPANKTRV